MQSIIRDSEDEEEEKFLVPEEHVASRPSQQSNSSWMVTTVDEILAENPTQGSESADQSSLSTGKLQRQIADASRGLFDSASDEATMKERSLASSSTPAAKKARRHSAAYRLGSSAAALKRTKTANVTYRSSKTSRLNDHGQFDALQDAGPPGTLQANFANHEPTVMFRDTGSTVVDNESSQQRMVEQAINQGRQLSNVADQKRLDSDKPNSSPFPWPVSSGPTQTPGRTTSMRSQVESVIADEMVSPEFASVDHTKAAADREVEAPQHTAEASPRTTTEDVLIDPQASQKHSPPIHSKSVMPNAESQSHSHIAQPPTMSSPQVSVPRVRVRSNTQTSTGPDKAPKGRKRKTSIAASVEPLNSDVRAIGHPKEMYQPRLSRRRATGLVEQPQDFSLVPENAAKRRRKTANITSAAPELAEDELALGPAAALQTNAVLTSKKSDDAAAATGEGATTAMMERPPPGRGEVRALLKDLDFPLTSTSFDAGAKEKPSPTKIASPLSAKKVSAAAIMTMLPPASPALLKSPKKRLSGTAAASALPPPSSSATRKSRRSHTTIFEDHVDLGDTQQHSPSLRQQQADRKSAVLKEVKNVSTQATVRKRRSIVQAKDDDEDGEDELVKDHVAEVPLPKKRGRPVKAPTTKITNNPSSADRVLQDSEAESDEQSIVEPPKKKGRPAQAPAAKSDKSAEKVLEDSEDNFTEHHSEDDEPPKKRVGGRPSKAAVTVTDDVAASAAGSRHSSRRASAASNPPATPLPDKQTSSVTKQDADVTAAAQAKSAPAAHTPIKTSTKVIHRVGLNRRQRVQPLLKMVQPPAPRPVPPTKKR